MNLTNELSGKKKTTSGKQQNSHEFCKLRDYTISDISDQLNETLNLFRNKPWFLRVCSIGLSKTLREKEKLLVTSNFSFSRGVFYLFGKLSAIFIKLGIVVCKLFRLEESKPCRLEKG